MKFDLMEQEKANNVVRRIITSYETGPSVDIIFEFTKRLIEVQKKLPPVYAKIIQEDFWDLL